MANTKIAISIHNYPNPKGKIRKKIIESFFDIYESWNIQLKEIGKPFSNLYQSMPPSDFTKKFMLDYLVSKKGNIIVVNDAKKLANRDL